MNEALDKKFVDISLTNYIIIKLLLLQIYKINFQLSLIKTATTTKTDFFTYTVRFRSIILLYNWDNQWLDSHYFPVIISRICYKNKTKNY